MFKNNPQGDDMASRLFMDLDSSIQNLFGNNPNNVSMQKLIEVAGLKDEKNFSQAKLIQELKIHNINASVTDIVKVHTLATLVEPNSSVSATPKKNR